MKEILNHLFEHKTLSKSEATEILKNIALNKYNNSQIAAFMTVYLMRSITVEELEGFRDAMLDLCIGLDLNAYNPIDLCGTGGDGKNTFNISTLASFVVAGAGQAVAKHGNYGVSSACGSSNVLEYFGIKFTSDKNSIQKQLDQANICILHAPLFHPALKNVAPIRRELGVKTFFNMLGPMVNPAFPKNQMVGVFSLELARLYAYLYQQTDKNFSIVHSLDGYDEISLTSDFKVFSRNEDILTQVESLNTEKLSLEQISGGDTIEESAQIFMNVLKNEGTQPQKSVVVANASMALKTAQPHKTLTECIGMATESLESGKALQAFETLKKVAS
ncbi:anthranilate phosphoribosyltransferase [bacterium 336/3]|nr:anthranilate phosphoribosyltransferase [bacterium 336/3]